MAWLDRTVGWVKHFCATQHPLAVTAQLGRAKALDPTYKSASSRSAASRSWRAVMMLVAATLVLAAVGSFPALAVDPGEALADPKLEIRARGLSAELRCLVCQNQSIDDSNAPLAKDLRRLVRERITAGDSDRDVMRYIVDRYGEFVLLRPPFALHTLFLWGSPLLVLLATVGLIAIRRRGAGAETATAPLTPDEQRALAKLMAEDAAEAAPKPAATRKARR